VTQPAVAGDDGLLRCPWGHEPAEYRDYHDHEWGRPVVDDRAIFEKLCLEGFQSGLSWLTILRKREGFRRAFAGFDIAAVAAFDDEDVARLLDDPGIIRHRGKIEATVANARATHKLRSEGGTLAALLWRHEPVAKRSSRTTGEIPAVTTESAALSKELKRWGFRFIGPTTAYAAMQALGVVDDHVTGCYVRAAVEEERAHLIRPSL
jgi:DNA-3-methyladenine glycosylase I